MNSNPLLVPLLLAAFASAANCEDYICKEEAGCMARINDGGEIVEVDFRKGDLISTEVGWVISPDDGWKKVETSAATSSSRGPGGNIIMPLFGSEVANGSKWMWGSSVVTARVTDHHWGDPSDVQVGATDSTGSSPNVPGSGGPTSTPDAPTADDSDVATTPGGAKYRVEGGKMQRLNKRSGQWVDGKLVQTPQSAGGATH